MDYDSFKELLDSGDPLAKERRYAGKFCNLSFQYRVGLRKARIQARVQYDMVKTMEDIKGWRQAWLAKHPGVNIYWSHAPQRARQNGYAETLAGRRFYINKWDADNEWSSSSSAINFPVQGSGGDMKNLAIKHIYENYPELQFMWDLHDGLFYMVDRTPQAIKLCQQVRQDLDNLNYKEAWSYEPEVPLTWDLQVGLKWSKMKEV
jgi:DNA polymerase-1